MKLLLTTLLSAALISQCASAAIPRIGAVRFEQTTLVMAEPGLAEGVTILRTGAVDAVATCRLLIYGGDTSSSATVTFPVGVASIKVSLSQLVDDSFTGPRSYFLSLTIPRNYEPNRERTARLTVLDDEPYIPRAESFIGVVEGFAGFDSDAGDNDPFGGEVEDSGPDEGSAFELSTAAISATGRVTMRVAERDRRYIARGRFDATGRAVLLAVARRGASPFSVEAQYLRFPGTDLLSVNGVTLYRVLRAEELPAVVPAPGLFTDVFVSSASPSATATLRVNAQAGSGILRFSGRTFEGRPFVTRAPALSGKNWLMSVKPFGRRGGTIAGSFHYNATERETPFAKADTLTASLALARPEGGPSPLSGGYFRNIIRHMARYTPPPAGELPAPFQAAGGASTLLLTDALGGSTTSTFTWNIDGQVTSRTGPAAPTRFQFDPAIGEVVATIQLPGAARPSRVVLQYATESFGSPDLTFQGSIVDGNAVQKVLVTAQ